ALAAQQAAAEREQIGAQAPAGTPEQQSDGSVAPPLTPGNGQAVAPQAPPQTSPSVSENANRRIQDLISEMRDKDRQIAELAASKRELDDVRGQVTALQQERDRFVNEHLDALDPEQRAAVLAEGRFREMLAQNNRMLLEQLQPTLTNLQSQGKQTEYD